MQKFIDIIDRVQDWNLQSGINFKDSIHIALQPLLESRIHGHKRRDEN